MEGLQVMSGPPRYPMKRPMHYNTFRPPAVLAGYVRYFWVLEGDAGALQPLLHRTLASFRPELIFHYKGPFEELLDGNRTEKSFLTGVHAQTVRYRRFLVRESFGILGAVLEPYAIPALFGIPSLEIRDRLPGLSDLLGRQGAELEEKVMLARDLTERIGLVSNFLESRLLAGTSLAGSTSTAAIRPEIVHAAARICEAKGHVNLPALAAECCLSPRQLERKFKEQVGFSPKLFSRIVRFKSLLCHGSRANGNGSQGAGDKARAVSLTQIALEAGYYDQAHFIQDFREFSGYNPRTYFSGKAQDVFYAPRDTPSF